MTSAPSRMVLVLNPLPSNMRKELALDNRRDEQAIHLTLANYLQKTLNYCFDRLINGRSVMHVFHYLTRNPEETANNLKICLGKFYKDHRKWKQNNTRKQDKYKVTKKGI